jgi:GNAT superfamily N-acetyltransferase
MAVRDLAKRISRIVLGEYSAYYIYARAAPAIEVESNREFHVEAVSQIAISASDDPLIREQAFYAGPEAEAYACFLGSRIIGVCFYWYGKRYESRNFWPLRNCEAKLVQIVSLPDFRGRGVARTLIGASFRAMDQRGFRRAFARIWHSNVASLRAFERAGWVRIALVIEVNPLRRKRPIRICIRLHKASTRPGDAAHLASI